MTKSRVGIWLTQGAIVFAAIFLRTLFLGKQGLFLDEAWSWMASQLTVAEILKLLQSDPHPILYYLVLKAYLWVFPSSEAGLRFLSVLFSVISVGIILFIASRWFGKRAALIAGLLITLSSFDIYYAQETRMYTMLALLWVLSLFLLLHALQGHHLFFILWGLVNIALVWTHFYGMLVVITHLIIASGVWSVSLLKKRVLPQSNRWQSWPSEIPSKFFSLGMGISFTAIISIFPVIWKYKSAGAGGAWIPGYEDIAYLFGLLSIGLAAARTYFLDSAYLVIPALSDVPLLVWGLLGMVFFGGMAVWGIVTGWKSQTTARWVIVSTLASILLPIMGAFIYAIVFERAAWAYKPFIGAMYLFFLFVGLGFARISQPAFRYSVVIIVICLSLISLIPYYTTWQKSDARMAFQSLPELSDHEVVLVEKAYLSPLAYYYLGQNAQIIQVLGTNAYNSTDALLVRVDFGDTLLGRRQSLDCDACIWDSITSLWVYGANSRVWQDYQNWPDCVKNKDLYLFENGRWVPLDS